MTTDTPGTELALRTEPTDTDSWIPVIAPVGHLAERIADTEFVPRGLRGSAAAVAAAILYGREVGLPPMTALNMTHVVEGKPGLSAEGMRALVYAAGHELEFIETTGAVCRMRGRRRGQEGWTELAWTLDMARAAGLLGKTNWKNYPRALLQARCTTELCRMLFPDVIHGFRSVEELEDMGGEDGDTAPPAAIEGPKTKVSRKRATPKRAGSPPTPAEPRSESAPPVLGPPLPGEPGYDTPPAADVPDESPPPTGEGDSGTLEGASAETPVPAPEEPSEDVAEGEIVEDPPTVGEAAEQVLETAASPRPMSKAQGRMQHGQFHALSVEDRDERLHITSVIVGREVTSSSDLTHDEASILIDTLGRAKDYNALNMILEAVEQERAETP